MSPSKGMWNPEMTFYNDVLVDQLTDQYKPIQVKSLVGLLPLVACGTINFSGIRCIEELRQVLQTDSIHIIKKSEVDTYFLTCVPPERITNLLQVLFEEEEFLSNFGIRSLSKVSL
ncbi:hypothetical protein AM593_04314, partial [Mytilus galloprovincialis]